MSIPQIHQYYNNLERAKQFGKSTNETAIRNHFWMLLYEYAKKQNYDLITEVTVLGTNGKKVRPDGVIRNLFGLDIGLWESKDEKTNIDDEIDLKIKTGYPLTNILFEDSATVILYQRGEEKMRIPMLDADKLHTLITAFISFKNETVYKFETALENFKADIPKIVEALRLQIESTGKTNPGFIQSRDTFLELCKAEINPEITLADVREMMIQHLLTSDIFNRIFNDPDFHRHNTIARELETLIEALFNYSERRNLLGNIEHYYKAISAAAAEVVDHHEKQKFLKVLYENFYKVYNPKAADRLGVVYTPNEIVQFMVESTDYLLHKHFGKTLADKNVDILDPATGTGTFITSIIDHIPNHLLAAKYKNELHANEVAILPYYIANLNIEFTFKQKMGLYEEFQNLCFVDTLDNVDALTYAGKQHNMFGFNSENSERIKRQNSRKISVIIGNPPYNANQANENDDNKNRKYPAIDKRIKETFINQSTAKKTKVYDMYARFYRWAMDRVDKNGVIALITNNSFVNKRTYDGFRKTISDEYDFAYIIDLGGDITELSGKDGIFLNEKHTIFGAAAAVGIGIMFLIKKETKEKSTCQINYIHPNAIRATRLEKLDYLKNHSLDEMPFERIKPDKSNNWINLSESNFERLIPTNPITKQNSIFAFTNPGVSTNRDSWVYGLDKEELKSKIVYTIKTYDSLLEQGNQKFPDVIKWSHVLKNKFNKKQRFKFDETKLTESFYRPFSKLNYYCDLNLSDLLTENHFKSFGENLNQPNHVINYTGPNSQKPFLVLANDKVSDLHFVSAAAATQCLPLYRYDKSGNRQDNITDWALNLFREHYQPKPFTEKEVSALSDAANAVFTGIKLISKEDIFHYTYAVLHNPTYRKKYELDLKREFPRLPLYADFFAWSAYGKQLMDLHINYETAAPFDLKLVETLPDSPAQKSQKALFPILEEPEPMFTKRPKLKVKLKADKESGTIELDEQTALTGVPKEAWAYKLGNRSALEWVLDQYKEKKPSDPTIAEKFNTYRFADYKEQVIDLLKRVCTVSVETIRLVAEMEKLEE